MSIPTPSPSPEDQIAILRQELKQWEKTFAAANDGRKAGREDIKKDAVIAAKYREYDRLRRPQSRKSESQSKPHATEQRTVAPQAKPVAATPQKRKSLSEFPPLPVAQFLADEEDEDQEDEIEPTPAAVRMQLGPTPLKDGQILSLFDCLSSGTPSKPRSALESIEGNMAATPSKSKRRNTTISESPAIEHARGSRTPASSGKRFMLDSFATPLKRKREEEDGHGTPSSSMKLLATPAFLRRSNTMSIMDSLAEEAEQDGEMIGLTRPRGPPFKKKKGFIRSLSSIIQGMRNQEDDMLDEEMEMMREMDDVDDMAQKQPLAKTRTLDMPEPEEEEYHDEDDEEAEVVIEDSQIVMPLGPDQAPESSEEEDDGGQNGRVRKPWKKKGLKRQTKRTNMRPVIHKAKKADPAPKSEPDLENGVDNEAVAETQLQAADLPDDYYDESDYSDSEAKVQRSQDKAASKHTAITKTDSAKENEGPVKKAAKKISAQAHANFRRLKIKSLSSKPNNGKGRFGRR